MGGVIERIAKERRVEKIVENVSRRHGRQELDDLAQSVYEILLTYGEERVAQLESRGETDFFISRIVMTQYRLPHSRWHRTYMGWDRMTEEYDEGT